LFSCNLDVDEYFHWIAPDEGYTDGLKVELAAQRAIVKCGQGFSINSGFGTARSASSWMVGKPTIHELAERNETQMSGSQPRQICVVR